MSKRTGSLTQEEFAGYCERIGAAPKAFTMRWMKKKNRVWYYARESRYVEATYKAYVEKAIDRITKAIRGEQNK